MPQRLSRDRHTGWKYGWLRLPGLLKTKHKIIIITFALCDARVCVIRLAPWAGSCCSCGRSLFARDRAVSLSTCIVSLFRPTQAPPCSFLLCAVVRKQKWTKKQGLNLGKQRHMCLPLNKKTNKKLLGSHLGFIRIQDTWILIHDIHDSGKGEVKLFLVDLLYISSYLSENVNETDLLQWIQ